MKQKKNESGKVYFLMITFNTARIYFLVDAWIIFFQKLKHLKYIKPANSTAPQMANIIWIFHIPKVIKWQKWLCSW